jgi:hypothetical protein
MVPLSAAAFAAFALSTSGCAALISGDQDADASFIIDPHSDGTFWGWTEITVGADINSVGPATLTALTIEVDKPEGYPDLNFLSSLKAETVTSTARTTVATLDRFPAGEQALVMNIVYQGDLHPLFKTNDTIRIEWSGTTNPAFTDWPAGGFSIKADVKINIQ